MKKIIIKKYKGNVLKASVGSNISTDEALNMVFNGLVQLIEEKVKQDSFEAVNAIAAQWALENKQQKETQEETKKTEPPTPKEVKGKRASFRVRPSVWDSLTEWSKDHEYAVSNALELAITELMERYK